MRIKSVTPVLQKFPECDITTITENFYVSTGSDAFLIHNSPALLCGYNPENNKFFVATKSIAAKTPKVNYTVNDIQTNHGMAPGLAEKLRLALMYLPNVIKSNVYQCDFMFDKNTIKEITYEGKPLLAFKPNTIMYAVERDSAIGKSMQAAEIGVVFHTRYTGPTLQQLTKSADVNVDEFNKHSTVWFDDAKFKDVSGVVTLTTSETATISKYIDQITAASKTTKWETIPDSLYMLINTYINSLIRQSTFVGDAIEEFDRFKDWYTSRIDKEISKLKTASGQQKKEEAKQRGISFLDENEVTIANLFNITKIIANIKDIFIKKYNTAIKTKQFLVEPDGSLKVTPGEGYVAVDREGNMVKLVDRLEFSRANFSVAKGDKFN